MKRCLGLLFLCLMPGLTLGLLLPAVAHAGWAVNGDAVVIGNQVLLTPEANDQAGSAWIETQIDLSKDFDISFRISLGDRDADGADGISFALQSDSSGTAAFGDTSGGGEWIGMNGICPAVSVEVDTYQNTGRGDPAADHVGVNVYTPSGGTCSGVPNHSGGGPVQADATSTDVEDGVEHDLRVTWDVATTTMTVYFDGTQRLVYVNDIVTNVFSASSMVYFGFTASTGGAYNEQYIIPNSAAVDAIKSAAPSVFLLSTPGKQTTYTIDITNDGIVTSFGTQISDLLPTGFTYIPGTTTGATTSDPVIDNGAPLHQELSWNLSATPIPPNGGTVSISFDVAIDNGVGVGSYRNDFVISGDNFTTIARSQTAAIDIGPANLAIDKSHTGTFSVGNNETFDLDVSNGGPDVANNITVTDTVPAGLTYVSFTGTGWSVDASGAPTIVWTHPGPLSSGGSLPAIAVTVLVDVAAVPSVTNTASVTSPSPDSDLTDNSDSDVIAVYNADLSIDKAHVGDFTVGVDGVFTLDVANAGPDDATAIVVSDTLPAGLTYSSYTGSGWSVDTSAAPTITWTHPGPVASGSSLPTIAVTVAVDAAGVPSVLNTASVTSALPDTSSANDSDSDTITVNTPSADVAIQKNHVGSFSQGVNGDYEIVVSNNGPQTATGFTVSDTLPAGLSYVSSTGTGWTVDTSGLPIVSWTHPGPLASSASLPPITLTVLPGSSAVPSVTNSASVTAATTDGDLSNNSDSDPTTVLGSGAGNKPLYVRGNTTRLLSRDPTAGTVNNVRIPGANTYREWAFSTVSAPVATVLAEDLILAAGAHPITLWIHRNALGSSRSVTVELAYLPPAAPRVSLGAASQIFTIASGEANTTSITFTVTLASQTTVPVGSALIMRVTNSTGANNRRIFVHPAYGGSYSTIDLSAVSVIEIDSVTIYDAAYPAGSPTTAFAPGASIWVRAAISDPFGFDDITGAAFDIVDANGLPLVSGAAPTASADVPPETRIYEYAYTLPASPIGLWTARARAIEGTEGLISDVDTTTFTVQGPMLSVTKVSSVISDPAHGSSSPHAIPGAVVEYSVGISNQGLGSADADSFTMTDSVPDDTQMFLGDLAGVGSGPVRFLPGAVACGLSYTFITLTSTTDDVSFSSNDGVSFDYIPSPVGDYDSNVTDIVVNPKGIFQGNTGTAPSCTIIFRVRID